MAETMLYSPRYKYYNCGHLAVYQATIHNRCSQYPPPESTFTQTRGMSHPFRGPRTVACGLTGTKHASMKCQFISSWCRTHKECSSASGRTWGAAPRELNVCGQTLIRNCPLFWCGELRPEFVPAF